MTPPAIVIGVVKQFREEGGVTIHSMFGVLCLYLLIGLIFAVAFAVIQDISSTDFFTTKDGGRDDFLYFSLRHPDDRRVRRPDRGDQPRALARDHARHCSARSTWSRSSP